jgi:hypothetical protein
MVLNQTIINFSLKKTELLNQTELLIMNQTEPFQFGFKTVSYGSVFLIRFSLTVQFDFFVFLPIPNSDITYWTVGKNIESNNK